MFVIESFRKVKSSGLSSVRQNNENVPWKYFYWFHCCFLIIMATLEKLKEQKKSTSDLCFSSVKISGLVCNKLEAFHFWVIASSQLQFVGNKAKGRIAKRMFQILRKTNISYPLICTRCAYHGVRKIRFSENLACFVFLKRPFWDSLFCLITVEVCFSVSYVVG